MVLFVKLSLTLSATWKLRVISVFLSKAQEISPEKQVYIACFFLPLSVQNSAWHTHARTHTRKIFFE